MWRFGIVHQVVMVFVAPSPLPGRLQSINHSNASMTNMRREVAFDAFLRLVPTPESRRRAKALVNTFVILALQIAPPNTSVL